MSTDLGVTIRVDAPQALPAINAVEAALGKVEARGPSVSAALSAGMREGSSAAEKARASTASLAEQFQRMTSLVPGVDGLTQALQREQTMLEQIRGPAQKYQQDLQTLASLHDHGRVSAQEYETQLEKLNKTMSTSKGEGGGFGAIGGQLGGAAGAGASLLGGLASSGVVEAAGVFELGKALIELNDDHIMLMNSADRLAGSMRSSNVVLGEQLDIAGKLHGSLEQTIELSQVVKERTEDLNLTYDEQLRLTESIGDAALLQGRSLQDAAGLVDRVSFALEQGLPAGRQMQMLMREYPAISDAMTDHFGKTRKEIIDLAQKGKLSFSDFTTALIDDHDKLADKADNVTKTMGQRWQHFKDGLFTVNTEDLAKFNQAFGLPAPNESVADAWAKVTLEIRKQISAFDSYQDKIKSVAQTVIPYAMAVEKFAEGLQTPKEQAHQFSVEDSSARSDKVREARVQLVGLNEELKKGLITGLEYRSKYEELTTTIEGGVSAIRAVYKEVMDPIRDYNEKTAATVDLLRRGGQNAALFRIELEKLAKAAPPGATGNTDPSQLANRLIGRGKGFDASLTKPESFLGIDRIPDVKPPTDDPYVNRVTEMANRLGSAGEKFARERDELLELFASDKANTPLEVQAKILDDLREKYASVKSPAAEFAKTERDLHSQLDQQLITQKQYNQLLDETKLKLNVGAGAAVGFSSGLDQIEKSINVAAASQKLLTDGFHGLETAITDLVTKGSTNFSSLVDSMIADLVRLGEQKLLADLLGLGGTPLTADKIVDGMKGLFGGGATGGDIDIPHAATGFAGVVGGHGGTDSKLAMFRVTPGEQVQIRTPEQMAAAKSAQGGASAAGRPQVHVHLDKRALLDSLDSDDGHATVINVLRKNAGAVKSLLK